MTKHNSTCISCDSLIIYYLNMSLLQPTLTIRRNKLSQLNRSQQYDHQLEIFLADEGHERRVEDGAWETHTTC